jgi:hypothetical protein
MAGEFNPWQLLINPIQTDVTIKAVSNPGQPRFETAMN